MTTLSSPTCWIIASPKGAGKTTFALQYLPTVANRTMTNISPDTQKVLETLRKVAADTLERKQRLGHYAIIWKNGKPVAIGEDAPEDLAPHREVD